MKKRSIIILTVLMLVLGALTVFAANTDDHAQTIYATIDGSIEISAEDSLTWGMNVGENNSPVCDVVVASNKPWTLEITADNGGFFKSGNTDLQNPLHVQIDGGEIQSLVTEVSESASDIGGKTHEVTFHQEVVIDDPAGDYEINITYTVSHQI